MKKFLFLILGLFIFTSCSDECDFCGNKDCNGECQIQDAIVGEWVYDDVQNNVWEKLKLLSNQQMYISATRLTPIFLYMENMPGYYYYTNGNKFSFSYEAITGGKLYTDLKITEIKKYSYTAEAYTDNGMFSGTYEYNRVVDAIELKLSESTTPRYDYLIPNIDISFYSSNNEDIATVNASTGKITAGNTAGLTYIKAVTSEGNALIEVKVIDPDNLFPDFSSALNMTTTEAERMWGKCNKDYSNVNRYLIKGNDYAKTALLYFNENNQIDTVCIELKDQIYYTKDDIHKFLSSKYDYQEQTYGMYMYFDLSQPDILPMVIYYDPEYNEIYYIKITSNDLWPDYSEEFGKTMAQIKSKYGSAWFDGDNYSYFWVENDYINYVGFTVDKTSKKCYAASAFLKSSCNWNEALNYLDQKYYLYEAGCNTEEKYYAFINAPTLSKSTIAISFDGKIGCITYVDRKYINSSVSTEDLWPDFSEEFGKTMDEIKGKYGSAWYDDDNYSIFSIENDYIVDVLFATDENTKKCYLANAYLKSDCDNDKALDFIKNKYYYYITNDEGMPVFINNSDVSNATVIIIYSDADKCFQYKQLSTTARSAKAKTKMLKNVSIREKSFERPKK